MTTPATPPTGAHPIQCPTCGETPWRHVLTKQDPRFGQLDLVRCSNCKLVFLKSWQEGFPAHLYEYYWSDERDQQPTRRDQLNRQRTLELLNELSARAPGRRVLDVGCGDGTFVELASTHGWEASGIDLAEGAIARCKSRSLPCELRDFFDPKLDQLRPSVIYMSEFIEHVPHPSRFLARATELLAPGGIIYLTTPNFGSLTQRITRNHWRAIHPEHLTYFDSAQITALLRQNGLTVEQVATANISVAELLSFLKRPSSGTSPSGQRGAALSDREREIDQHLRAVLAASGVLTQLKKLLNRALNTLDLGDTLVVVARKPGRTFPRNETTRSNFLANGYQPWKRRAAHR